MSKMAKKQPELPKGLKDKKIKSVKNFEYEVVTFEDDTQSIRRKNSGFGILELLGIASALRFQFLSDYDQLSNRMDNE